MAPKLGEIPKLTIIYYGSWKHQPIKGGRKEGQWDARDEARIIDSYGTGLGPIFAPSSAAVPPASIIHILLLLIQAV